MVQCHRGQFSNRLMCIKAGVLLARALQRVLVLPVFTDNDPVVDVSEYVSLECFRRNNQVVTFGEFRERLCRGVGLDVPAAASGAARGTGSAGGGGGGGGLTADGSPGSFCEDGALLQLETSYSLADYRGYTCWARREDITNARDLGVEIKRCSHIPPQHAESADSRDYHLDQVRAAFGGRAEKVLLFLDLFGVELLPAEEDLAATVAEPGQMCGWMPPERAAAAADVVMQALIPGQPAAAAGDAADASQQERLAGAAAVVLPGGVFTPQSYTDAPPPIRLRGTRPYMAVHLRRSDWFYYCAGSRDCFYSMTEAGAWLNASLASRGLDTLYVSTNADEREKQMLLRAVSGRVLFWEDVLVQLRRWQGGGGGEAAVADAAAAATSAAAAPAWLSSLPLDDALMVQMVEKAICMQASHFVSSRGSTFSNQIRDFRDGGLEGRERDLLVRKWGPEARVAAARAVCGALADEPPPPEPATFLCDDRPPLYPDGRRFPDYHNPNIFLQQVSAVLAAAKQAVAGIRGGGGAAGATPSAAAAEGDAPARRAPTVWDVLLAPWRLLERLVLLVEDGHAMSAANRFVAMYSGGSLAGLVVEGVQRGTAEALAECVAEAAGRAGAVALHVSMAGVPAEQQVLLMQALEARGELRQITRMGGAEQERGNTFTLLWRGDGLGRRAEPALLESLPTFLERTEPYVLAKSRLLLGDSSATLFRQVASLRGLFGFDDPRDGQCGPEDVLARSRRA